MTLQVLARADHPISRKLIAENALKVLYRLHGAGYQGYLVGGCLRDIMVGITPKDYDIATDATPEQIRSLFKNCRLIGRRFRLAHIYFGREIIEVATFRAPPQDDSEHQRCEKSGIVIRDNVFGSIEEDALRRDFTVNALYYNIDDFSLSDYTSGLADIEAKKIRIIGDATERYQEDPVRMLRGIRLAAKLGFTLEENTATPIHALGYLLGDIASARLFDETVKLFHGGKGQATYHLLQEYHLFEKLFPLPAKLFQTDKGAEKLFLETLKNTDLRIEEGKPVTPAFILAVLFFVPWFERVKDAPPRTKSKIRHHEFEVIFKDQAQYTSIPRHFLNIVKDMWSMQFRLTGKIDKRVYRVLSHPRFRASYDLLLLRAATLSPELKDHAAWWTDFQHAKENDRPALFEKAKTLVNH